MVLENVTTVNRSDLTQKTTLDGTETVILSGTQKVPVLNIAGLAGQLGYATKIYVDIVDLNMKLYVDGLLSAKISRSIVSALPTTDISTSVIYMIPKSGSDNDGSNNDVYDEYMYVNEAWELIGSTQIDLTGLATEAYVDTAVGNVDLTGLATESYVTEAINTAITTALNTAY